MMYSPQDVGANKMAHNVMEHLKWLQTEYGLSVKYAVTQPYELVSLLVEYCND